MKKFENKKKDDLKALEVKLIKKAKKEAKLAASEATK